MTRINVGIHPKMLTRQHLIAEHREIKRAPNQVKSGRARVENATDTFTLNKGHVTFFYRRLGYLRRRYRALYEECQRRHYEVQNYEDAWSGVPDELMGDYTPTEADRQLLMERLQERDPEHYTDMKIRPSRV